MTVMDNLQMFKHYKDCPIPQTFVINYVLCLNCLLPYLHPRAQHYFRLSSTLCLPCDDGIPCTKVRPYIICPPLEICINNSTFFNRHIK